MTKKYITMMTKDLLKNEGLFLQDAEEQQNGVLKGGLYNGYTGMAIVYYLLAKNSGNGSMAEKGLNLLDYVSETGISREDVSFSAGLAGIGWAIEWLAQNELVEDVNTDELLEPVDSILYLAVSYNRDGNPTLSNGTLGKITYFAKRAVSRNANINRYKTIGHLECLVLLLDDLADKAGGWDDTISLSHLAEILVAIPGLRVKVNSPVSGNILFGAINATERLLSGSTMYSGNNLDLLYLAICYLIAARQAYNKYWEARAIQHVNRLIAGSDDRAVLTSEQLFQKLAIYSLLNLHIPAQAFMMEVEQLITTLSSMKLPPTLVYGRGALVMAELCLANPELIASWHEVMLLNTPS